MVAVLPQTEAMRPAQLDAVTVEKGPKGRVVKCFCDQEVSRSVVPHFKAKHPTEWQEWTETFVTLRGQGWPLKRIMRLFCAGNGPLLFSWTVIERAIRQDVEAGKLAYTPPPHRGIKRWAPEKFELERTTIWDFPRRGNWAVHSGDYRGNWPPQIPRNLIERYTQPGDLVVDAFAGGGTTLIEAWLLGRPSIGLDLSKLAIQTVHAKLKEMERLAVEDGSVQLNRDYRPKVLRANALRLSTVLASKGIHPSSVKLICAHPPYLDSLQYTTDNEDDLALIHDPTVFCQRIFEFAREARAVLAPEGVCAVLIGDVRKKGRTFPLGLRTLDSFLAAGFVLDTIVVKTQHRDRSSEFYFSQNNGEMLMAHEYLFILHRNSEATSKG
ncbi:MAG: DNA methyltransferase [Dehalococcoidia bacterium]|nr:DNA methyltransferase [Dehalococcoidia bacterium]